MKMFIPCRHTLGDVLAAYFCPVNYGSPNPKAALLARLRNACLAGACEPAMVISELDFWRHVDFPVVCRRQEPLGLTDNGWEQSRVEGYVNLLRDPPPVLWDFPEQPVSPLPYRRPAAALPPDYTLFTDGAGTADRSLDDPGIVQWLQRLLPVVRIGSSGGRWALPLGPRGSTPADVDLTGTLDLTEVFFLAKHAKLIVSPCTYLRTMSRLFDTPVLELVQSDRVQDSTIARTVKEYCGREYGMRPGLLNAWCFWDGTPSADAQRQAEMLLSRRCPERPITAALTPSVGRS